jgi:hypothetical protein
MVRVWRGEDKRFVPVWPAAYARGAGSAAQAARRAWKRSVLARSQRSNPWISG